MGRSKILAFFIVACVLTQAYALKCWTCSSDNRKIGRSCQETLDESGISAEERDLSYRECVRPNQIAYCRKETRRVNGNLVYRRSCYGKPANAPAEQCYDDEPQISWVQHLDCQLCTMNGCNAAKNITNDAPSNMSINGPNNAPTNAPNNGPTNATTNSPPSSNTEKKGDSSDATQFDPIALLCMIPVVVARSFLLQLQ